MPEEIQKIIQDYARPLWTRKDWRTCKRAEAFILQDYNDYITHMLKLYYTMSIDYSLLINKNRLLQAIRFWSMIHE